MWSGLEEGSVSGNGPERWTGSKTELRMFPHLEGFCLAKKGSVAYWVLGGKMTLREFENTDSPF